MIDRGSLFLVRDLLETTCGATTQKGDRTRGLLEEKNIERELLGLGSIPQQQGRET